MSVVMEQMLRLLISLGLPANNVDFINCDGPTMQRVLRYGKPRTTLFTGSSRVGELLCKELKGKIKLEDAGFDWKVGAGSIGVRGWRRAREGCLDLLPLRP